MFGDLMSKMQEAKTKMDAAKARLDTITVVGEAQGVKVIITGNREVKEVFIPQLLVDNGDAEEISELVLLATNKALKSAHNVNETEMQSAATGLLGNIPGLGL